MIHSDDWGHVGVRDVEGAERLRASGLELGQNPYDFYTLETADDVSALAALLAQHRDSTGRSAVVVTNFILANLDFRRMAAEDYQRIYLHPLHEGLPGNWQRPGLYDAYRNAIAAGLFYPSLHGLTHFCHIAMERALRGNSERTSLLRKLWLAQTPYIYWRMPWVGFEYCNPERPQRGFLKLQVQEDLVRQAAVHFVRFFEHLPISACAPGYRANRDTRTAWRKLGILTAQIGVGAIRHPLLEANGLLIVGRSLDFEPVYHTPDLDSCMQLAGSVFARGAPLVISVHAINFHSTVKNFRDATLPALHNFLAALERKYPDLLYVHDGDLYQVVTKGQFASASGVVRVVATQLKR